MNLQRLSSLLILAVSVVGFATGCGQRRTVLIPPGTPVMLAEPVQAKIRYYDDEGVLIESDGKVELPEGWWCLPDPGEPTND